MGSASCLPTWVSGTSQTPLNPNPRPGLAEVLVPASPVSPVYVTICRYAGLNQNVKEGDLERSQVLMGAQLSGLVTYLDNPSWQKVPANGVFACPMSIGSIDILQFAYSGGPNVTVSVDIDGCPFVSNGQRVVSSAGIGQRLADYVGSDSYPG